MLTKNASRTAFAIAAAALMLTPLTSQRAEAQEPGRHPAYLHALSDLRAARTFLDKLTPNERLDEAQAHAIQEINEAISTVERAALDDHKGLREQAPIDAHIAPGPRFRKAQEALTAALRDVNQEEDDPRTRDVKARSIAHIQNALNDVRRTMANLHVQ